MASQELMRAERAEARFRVWAFHVYYNRAYRTEDDPVMRFYKALMASIRPIANPELLSEVASRLELGEDGADLLAPSL